MVRGEQLNGAWNGWRIAGWGGLAALLFLPLVAMRFTTEVDWSASDFAVMGLLLGTVGLVAELLMRQSGSVTYRAGAAIAIAAAFLLVWVNLAVGFLGDENNLANLMFFAVLAAAAGGAILVRLRPAGMARAMVAAAGVQVLIGSVALLARLGSPGAAGDHEAVMGTSLFTGLWLASAWLFHKAAGAAAA